MAKIKSVLVCSMEFLLIFCCTNRIKDNDIATGDVGIAEDTSSSSISGEKNTGELNNKWY
jgi:hypothetical protein